MTSQTPGDTSHAGTTHLEQYQRILKFPLDPFQLKACAALEGGHGVLVCAPTGAGKTVPGEFAVYLALQSGTKCFYTTPIKALSNQKYADFVARYGIANVGLLTGDQSINADASVVVMTTEVLRNMLYANSETLRNLQYVVMDEVHYLADRFRGAVWEEVILHLPEDVRLVGLSATVSNAEEFGAWIQTVRGDITVVVDEHRPVPLFQHVMVGKRLFDLFDQKASGKVVVDQDLVRYLRHREMTDAQDPWARRRGASNHRPIPRPDVIAKLDSEGLLPAITFIFSRAGCDAAVRQCLASRLRVNPEEAVARIDEIVQKHTGELPRADLEVLGFWDWREALHRGFAAHHAGMLPAFRHTVEELFVNGLVRAVFATETLALGINMPARTVVLEKLIKYNGEAHVELTPGEYTQLTGRAGRRGIDVEGHAVVLWYPELNASGVAGLASTRTYPLKSSFTPGYNMSINLIGHLGAEQSRKLLERSFAQFQADASVVGLVRGIEKNDFQLAKLRTQLEGAGDGDFLEYVQLRERIKNRERELNRDRRDNIRSTAERDLFALRRGDVIAIPRGRHSGVAVVIEPARDEDDPRPVVVTEGAWSGRITIGDVPAGAPVLGTMRLPRHLERATGHARRDIASGLRSTGIRPPKGKQKRQPQDDDRELNLLRRALRSHPCHRAPDVEAMCRIGEQYHRILRETDAMRMKVATTTNSLVRTFDRIVRLLSERGYLADGEATEAGHRLARLYSESDLLVAECLRHRTWAGLGPVELAAVVSAMVYESRSEGGYDTAAGLNSNIRNALAETVNLWAGLREDEARHKLSGTREPDVGFAQAVFIWASGGSLADSLAAGGDRGLPLAAGDFVRWCRQVIDLLDQLKQGADDPEISGTAARAIRAIRRGVVAVDAA